MFKAPLFLLPLFCLLFYSTAQAQQWNLDLETGVAISGYNDVQIPGDEGTRFSLSEDLQADPSFHIRFRAYYNINERHHLGALITPLTIRSQGTLNRPLNFEGVTFAANTPLTTTYQFNSYRLMYRYDFIRTAKLQLGVGFTAKIRDAKIAVNSANNSSVKTNVGFVPIVNFRMRWELNNRFAFLVDGDALVAPQGRAEDILAAVAINISPKVALKVGYRVLEGGAANDEVYNFSWINYGVTGVIVRL